MLFLFFSFCLLSSIFLSRQHISAFAERITWLFSSTPEFSLTTYLHFWPVLVILNLNSHKDLIQQVWYELRTLFMNLLILIHGKYYMLKPLDIVLIVRKVKRWFS